MRLRTAHLICILLLLRSAPLWAYYEKAHQEVARVGLEILKRNDPERIYAEIYSEKNSRRILDGSWQEDFGAVGGHDRAFRHYWDPDAKRGCPWFIYFRAMPRLMPGSKVTIPYSALLQASQTALDTIYVPEWMKYRWYYPGALEWAKNGAGSGDLRNWEGAINAYSYSASSRAEAYWRLGHVVHLLTDMAEPDHTANVPHAASGFYYPKDLQKISILAEYIPGARGKTMKALLNRLKRQLQIQSWNQKKTVGYEEFIELNVNKLFPGTLDLKSNKRKAFDTFFSAMAGQSKHAVGDMLKFPLPLGISYLPERDQGAMLMLDTNKKNWSFFPSIDYQDKAEIDKFLNLTRPLVTSAARLDAGIMEFFHDIVDPPPYVRSVLIKQEGETRYHAWWKDNIETRTGRHVNENEKVESKANEKNPAKGTFSHEYSYDVVVSRELKKEKNEPLLPDKAASVRIEFGPDPSGFEYPPERIKKAWVKIGAPEIPGRLVNDGTAWQGQFTPSLDEGENETDLQMEIFAQDIHNHKANRITFSSQEQVYGDKEYQLDAEPEYPAKAMATPPYHWQKYRPNTDRNHRINVRKKGRKFDIESWFPRAAYAGINEKFLAALPSGFRNMYSGEVRRFSDHGIVCTYNHATQDNSHFGDWNLKVVITPYETDQEASERFRGHVNARKADKESVERLKKKYPGYTRTFEEDREKVFTPFARNSHEYAETILYKNTQISIRELMPKGKTRYVDDLEEVAKNLVDERRRR